MEDNITLIVKAANQSVADYHVKCNMDWTVLKLKQSLALSFPSKPSVEEQRLIYSGKLMFDNLDLRAVLRHPSENNSYIIHLVCSPPRPSRKSPTSTPTIPSPTQSMNRGPVIDPESTEGLRQRPSATNTDNVSTPHQELDSSTVYPMSPFLPNLNLATADPVQQMAAMHQMYAQYMASYMNYMQMSAAGNLASQPSFELPSTQSPPVVATSPTTTPAVDANDGEEEHRTPQVQAPQNQQPQPPQPQQPIRMNAQGGEVEDDDDEGRDWLDYAYLACRMILLLTIVYFYSTLSRFMLVISTGMMIYFYQAGWFRPLRRVEQVQAPQEPEQPVVPEQENNEDQQDDSNNNVQNNNNNEILADPDEAQNNENDNNSELGNARLNPNSEGGEVPQRPSLYALSWTFFTTFFTSLIPEQPQII